MVRMLKVFVSSWLRLRASLYFGSAADGSGRPILGTLRGLKSLEIR